MNVFETCIPRRTGTPIYLPDDEEYDTSVHNRNRSCFSCCLGTNMHQREGLIRLPTGPRARRTIDDYLDPRSPVSIEVLLAEQEEELDHYYGQIDDEDAFIANKQRRKYSLVSHNNTFFEEEDAQFLSEHRISAILVDRPKLSSAPENVIDSTAYTTQQDLLDVVIPAVSTSTSSISSRVFAIKIQPDNEVKDLTDNDETNIVGSRPVSDVLNITSSPLEMKSPSYHQSLIPSSSSCTASSSASSILSTTSTAEHDNDYVLPAHLVVGSSTSLSVFPTSNTQQTLATTTAAAIMTPSHSARTSEFPATTLTRTPYQPPPPMHTDIIPTPTININTLNPSSSLAKPTASPAVVVESINSTPYLNNNTTSAPAAATPFLGRRPSVVQAAQNLLGDKLDDFTEKLAFIKKNIIMSMDSDDEEELSQNNHYYDTAPFKNNKGRNRKSLEVHGGNQEQQQSSGGSNGNGNGGERSIATNTWDNFILPKFKKQPSTSTSFLQRQQQQQQQQMRFPRSTSIDLINNNAVPQHHVTRGNNSERDNATGDYDENLIPRRKSQRKRRISNASYSSSPPTKNDYDSEEEEIFDFSKVVAMSKNVRTFGEGVMGNGLRMFNNLSTRIKNANNNAGEVELNRNNSSGSGSGGGGYK